MNEKTKQIKLTIRKPEAGLPIDKAILSYYQEISRKKLRRILDMGGIKLNGKRVQRGSLTVATNDQVSILYSKQDIESKSPNKFSLSPKEILFENKDLIAINKAPLLASQASRSTAVPHVEPVVNAYFNSKGLTLKHQLCHRLDKETSGILLLGRNETATDFVMQQFKNKEVKKTYLALCYGIPKHNIWSVSKHLSPISKKTSMVRVVHSGGKPSFTGFKLLEAFPSFGISLVECSPKTGRSHQIRVHLESCGLPIVGDKKYGLNQHKRLPAKLAGIALTHHFLHAAKISLKSPNGKNIKVSAPLPFNFREFLTIISKKDSPVDLISFKQKYQIIEH